MKCRLVSHHILFAVRLIFLGIFCLASWFTLASCVKQFMPSERCHAFQDNPHTYVQHMFCRSNAAFVDTLNRHWPTQWQSKDLGSSVCLRGWWTWSHTSTLWPKSWQTHGHQSQLVVFLCFWIGGSHSQPNLKATTQHPIWLITQIGWLPMAAPFEWKTVGKLEDMQAACRMPIEGSLCNEGLWIEMLPDALSRPYLGRMAQQFSQVFQQPRCSRLQLKVHLNTALELSEQERWEEAAAAWEELLPHLSMDLRPSARLALGDALQKLGADEAALRSFREALAEAPRGAAQPALRVANALRRLGRFGEAERSYRRVLQRPRGSQEEVAQGVSGAAVMMLRQGRLSKQKRLLEVWTGMSPDDSRAAENLLLFLICSIDVITFVDLVTIFLN